MPKTAMPTTEATPPEFGFDNSYARDLPGLHVAQSPARVKAPRLLALNRGLAFDLGLDPDRLEPWAADLFSGNRLPVGAQPIAQAYAGHQFGGFSPRLGDGRALLLGEVIDRHGARRDIALKGSGPTPFSRGGDGYAAVGPVLREYLIGEAMHALHIPTSRALAAVATGGSVRREVDLPGAVLTRVAASHIRIGTFQFLAARGDEAGLRQLLAYAIARHYPDLATAENPALAFLAAVSARQADLIARWMGVGFIHGVMNTDNMTVSGETIDYGPCAFMEGYGPATVFSSIDHGGRYAYGNQPLILGWNLARLAEALLGLIDPDADRAVALATAELAAVEERYQAAWLAVMRAKLGLAGEEPGDRALVDDLLALMAAAGADWTLTFRALAEADPAAPGALLGAVPEAWLARGRARRAPDALARMAAVNPVYIPRNHLVEAALTAAGAGDMAPFEAMLAVITDPFTARPGLERYALPAPAGFGPYVTFCGT
ncbi:MAG: YdiU family protein [Pseudorhodobacter sp.]|nr:YdiU family protein [Pseudorhodobacter sp.]